MPGSPLTTDRLIRHVMDSTRGGALERLGAAVTVSSELAAQGDELVGHFVDAARREGCSWAQIGEQLGVTRQAAQQRFVATRPAATGQFERFSEAARAVVTQAQHEAQRLRHNYLGTEHLLLGLLGDADTTAARALEALGVSAALVRARVEDIIGLGTSVAAGPIPFTPRSKKVLQLAVDEADRMGDREVATEHVLLGLVREGEGVAAQVLADVGASGVRVCAELSALLGRVCEPGPARRRRHRWR